MNKLFKLFLIALVTFFTGCQTKTVLNHFEDNNDAAFAIQYTKKSDILINDEVKVLFFGTYLNKINEKYEDENKDSFVVGVHVVNEDNKGLFEDGFEMTLNGNAMLSAKTLDKNSKLFKDISLKNKWSKYYVVSFKTKEIVLKPVDYNTEEKTEKEKKEEKAQEGKLILKLSHPEFGQTSLTFEK